MDNPARTKVLGVIGFILLAYGLFGIGEYKSQMLCCPSQSDLYLSTAAACLGLALIVSALIIGRRDLRSAPVSLIE